MNLRLLIRFMGFLICASLISERSKASSLDDFGTSRVWKSILHYQRNILRFESSEVSGKNFFLAENGAKDPAAELRADLKAFTEPQTQKDENQKPVCRFPARVRLLIEAGLLIEASLPHANCSAYKVYKTRIQSKKVSVVFSSYYLGSASSIFGHSFLRFSGENENELFDTGINFSATPTTQNPILYALYGLIGVFPASFSAEPYYFKVREYNDFESRDLWTYELNLTEQERGFLLDHLWELGNTSFRYFYFNENCSYHILRAIEAAIPRIQFFKRRPVYLIPSESIQMLFSKSETEPKLVKGFSYRPSLRNIAYWRYNALDSQDQKLVLRALSKKENLSLVDSVRPSKAMDTLIDAIDLNFASEVLINHSTIQTWKNAVLDARAKLKDTSEKPKIETPDKENPSIGHPVRRLALSQGFSKLQTKTEGFTEVQLRAAHHDLLDPSNGYPPNLHIDFGRIGFRYFYPSEQFVLQELTLVDLTALAVIHPLYAKFSYDALIQYDRRPFRDCSDSASCGAIRARGGLGRAIEFSRNGVLYYLLDFEPQFGPSFLDSHFKFGIEPSLNLWFAITNHFKILFSGQAEYTLLTSHPFSSHENAEVRYEITSLFGLGLKTDFYLQGDFAYREIMLRGFYYF